MRMRRLRLELRMELHGEIPRVLRQFGDLDELAVRRAARDAHAVLRQRALVQAVELVAVTVPLGDRVRPVDALRQRSWRELAGVAAQAHGAAEIVDAEQIAQLVDHFRGALGIDFGRIGVVQTRDVARVLDRRPLEAVADPEVRNAALARDLRRLHHSPRSTIAESSRHEDAVGAVEQAIAARLLERLGFDPLDVHLHAVGKSAVIQRFVEALVRVLVADILADDVNRELVDGILDPVDEIFPRLHAPLGLRQVQILQDDPIEPFGGEHERDLVDGRHVLGGDDRFFVDVAEQRDLALDVRVEEAIGPAQQDVRLNADRSQIADAVLRRLRLQLAGGADERNERQMNVERVVAADVLTELTDGLEEGQALDVADRAADFDEHDVGVPRHAADRVLDFIGDVRDHLHRAAEIIAAAFLLNDALVNLARRPVRVLRRDRKSTRLNSSHVSISYAVFCLKKKNYIRYAPIAPLERFSRKRNLAVLLHWRARPAFLSDLADVAHLLAFLVGVA